VYLRAEAISFEASCFQLTGTTAAACAITQYPHPAAEEINERGDPSHRIHRACQGAIAAIIKLTTSPMTVPINTPRTASPEKVSSEPDNHAPS
jgi:hypothetical protein